MKALSFKNLPKSFLYVNPISNHKEGKGIGIPGKLPAILAVLGYLHVIYGCELPGYVVQINLELLN